MWILILTIAMQRNEPAVSVAAVPGFTSEASCMTAAKTWLDQKKNLPEKYGATSALHAMCAKA